MKRILSLILSSLILSSLLILMFSSCNTSSNVSSEGNSCDHDWKTATCTDPQMCLICGETQGEALGHTTTTDTCTRCGKFFGTWETGEFNDEFNQPTGVKYIVTQVNGTFSNSATTDSDLVAALQITSDEVCIMLWEYSRNLVKCTYKSDSYSITMLDSNNKKHYLSGTMYEGGTRIYIDDKDKSTVLNALRQSGTISFYLVYDEYTTSTYLFTVETSNFKSAYATLN